MYNEFKKGFTLRRTRNRKQKIQATQHKWINCRCMYEYAALWGELSIRKSYIHGQICDSCIGAAFQIEIQDTHALFHISFFFFKIHLCWLEPVQTISVLQKKGTGCSHDPFIRKCPQPLKCHINRLIVQLHTCCLQLKTQVKWVCVKTNLEQGYFLAEEYRDITSYLWSGGISITETTLCKYTICQSPAFKTSLEWKNVL